MTLLYEPEPVGVEGLEDELCRAFTILRDADEPVVVALDEADVAGVGDPAGAALAHGLLGMVRALAIEGRPITALAAPADVPSEERQAWVERLAGASGTFVRLGTDHLGRVPT
jgi:hypothetical protein